MSRRFVTYVSGGSSTPGSATLSAGSHLTTRPANTAFGTSVTCYQNAFTAYTAVGSALAAATDELIIHVRDASVAAGGIRSMVLRVGIDLAGGTTFTKLGDFLVGGVPIFNVGGGTTRIYLPMTIPAGATIGMVGSVNNVTPGTVRCWWRAGEGGAGARLGCTAIEEVGLTLASSTGTAVTPGQAAEGAWTLLGTLANAAKYMGVGADTANATCGSTIYNVDLAYSTDAGATKTIVVEDQEVIEQTSECNGFQAEFRLLAARAVPAGAEIYARAQCSTAPTAGFALAAWAAR